MTHLLDFYLFCVQWSVHRIIQGAAENWRFLSLVVLAIVWGGVMQPRSVARWFHVISVAMEQRTAQHRAFVVEADCKNGDSAITTQQLFLRRFNIPRHGRVPCSNTIKEWVQNFQENSSALKRKPRGRIPAVRTPENVDNLRMAIVKSPRCSVRRHSAAIGLWSQRAENFAQGS